MERPSADDVLHVPDRVVTRVVRGATVLLNADTGRYFTLDESGTRVWAALAAATSFGAAFESLLATHDVVPEVLRADLDALVADLVAEGLLELRRA